MRVVLLGPPGAGKGTQAKLLKEKLKLAHVSTGDILREEMKNGTDLGQKIQEFVKSGGLVPDEIVTQIVENKLKNDQTMKSHYVLDGFPRTRQQAEDLTRITGTIDRPIDYALYMDTSEPVIIKRLTGRRICRNCGAIFHVDNMPPKREGVCDNCGGELYLRDDDKEETVRHRLKVYQEKTAPVIAFYEEHGVLRKLNGDAEAQDVMDEILDIFGKEGKIDSDQVQQGN